jgi:protein-disulfide isomerase-like protein with CxxC motif
VATATFLSQPRISTARFAAVFLLFYGPVWSAFSAGTSPEADRAWQVILEQAGGPGTRFPDQAAAMAAARSHLEKQESALREFRHRFSDDPRHYSAEIRLSAVLAARCRMTGLPSLRAEADKILADLEHDPATPAPIKADAAFARVTQGMEDGSRHADPATRDALLRDAHAFSAAYPGDRRMAGLLAELATLYDSDPAQKSALLAEAAPQATDEGLRQRIADDQRRLALLGHPVEGRLTPWDGTPPVGLAALHGKVVVILFWASWSLPALHELAALEQAAPAFKDQPVAFVTVSLDQDRAALAATIKAADLPWPVACDYRGWKGELVRTWGINALPTVWILDRTGNLTTLNARGQEADSIRAALEKTTT